MIFFPHIFVSYEALNSKNWENFQYVPHLKLNFKMKLGFRNYPGSKKSTQARPIISTTLIGGFSTQCKRDGKKILRKVADLPKFLKHHCGSFSLVQPLLTAPISAAAGDLCRNSTSILILLCHFMTQNQKLRCSPETFRLSFYGIQGVPKKI